MMDMKHTLLVLFSLSLGGINNMYASHFEKILGKINNWK